MAVRTIYPAGVVNTSATFRSWYSRMYGRPNRGLGFDLGPIAANLPSGGLFDIAKGYVASKDAEKASKSAEKAAAAQVKAARLAAAASAAEQEASTARTKMLVIGGVALGAVVLGVVLLRKARGR